MTSHQLCEWAESNIHNLNFDFMIEYEDEEEEDRLSSRFATAETTWSSAAPCIYAGKGRRT
jgi:hypothetical protein